MTVLVKISDINDNSPVFDISGYSAKIYENATVGTEVVVVNASDIDEVSVSVVYI